MRASPALCALLLCLPGAACASTDDRAFEQRCARDMQPRIEVVARIAAFQVKDTFSYAVLSQRSYTAGVNSFVLGKTAGTVRTEIMIDGPGMVNATGTRECISPRIVVDIWYRPLDVYVAREFTQHSCPYREVYAHEMRHVGLYHEQLPLLEKRVRAALGERYGNQPLYAAPGKGIDQLQHDVDNWLRPLIREELATVEQLQRSVDTPEEIARMGAACLGEVAKIIGSKL